MTLESVSEERVLSLKHRALGLLTKIPLTWHPASVDAFVELYRLQSLDPAVLRLSNDSGILWASAFGEALRDGTLDLPDDEPLTNAEHLGPVPYVFVADEAFPLRRDMMRPVPGRYLRSYSQRIYNYRLSRARMMVEMAFGVMASQPNQLSSALKCEYKSPLSLQTPILMSFLSSQAHFCAFSRGNVAPRA